MPQIIPVVNWRIDLRKLGGSKMLSSEYKLLDFQADWCLPCQTMGKSLKEVMKNINNIELVKVDIDKEPDMARTYQIRSIPTLVLIKEGNIIGKMVGAKSVNEIKAFLQTA